MALFSPVSNLYARIGVIAVALLLAGGVGWWLAWPRTHYARGVGFDRDQPVPFSHQHHVAGLGIDCRFCHSTVEISSDAGMPPTYTCMTCHSQIWTNAALLAPVRRSLAENRPIAWRRITDLPDYVYFNHAIHVAKGVGCASCHGAVAAMPLMYKQYSLTMAFCLACHRNPGPNLRPADAIFDTEWVRGPSTPPPAALMARYGIGGRNLTECSICHR
ncbi:cytochrome c3 family protein [Nguyenibacter sp. L1]|uniref:cytochrome c3 family protein n=1 Tax=Nguyenibacter sp. L1 TaxID=3049350 RepID=UPI002B48CB59|nr:cytochrome c3 family protein [Nguyenibacter sp. L1]WRH88895.1 cytochrome c3 family protein [Nguyenibacter sp. L1]